jgi:hypothetical protein
MVTKGIDDDAALPVGIEPVAHVLGDAAAARAEVTAHRRRTIAAGERNDFWHAASGEPHAFPGQSKGHVVLSAAGFGYAVALGTQADNIEFDRHCSS